MASAAEPLVDLVRPDPQDGAPPYEQIRSRIATAVADGRLVTGTRLPPVRALAGELGLANATVARAYRELEQAGVVRTAGRAGTVVSGGGDSAREQAARQAAAFVAAARALGVPDEEAVALVRAAQEGA